MYTASLELCKRLFDLSGWKDTDHEMVYRVEKGKPVATNVFDERARGTLPLYDLGYLLRKFVGKGGIEIHYGDTGCIAFSQLWHAEADTPEDAVCLLAMKVFFKQNIRTSFPQK